jgi:hypothetical protein
MGNSNGFEIDTHDSHSVISSNFIDNYPINRFPSGAGNNVWSESGKGNFWNDYTGLDDGSGGRVAGDGVGDTDLPWHGVDSFPLVSPPSSFKVFWDNRVFPASLASNSTVSAFVFDQPHKRILYNVTSPADSTGYFNLSISKALLSGEWTILVDGTDYTAKAMIMQNQTYTSIYLTYNNSSHHVQINGTRVIPEYPFTSTALLAMLLALLTMTIASKITMRTNERQSIDRNEKSAHAERQDIFDRSFEDFSRRPPTSRCRQQRLVTRS